MKSAPKTPVRFACYARSATCSPSGITEQIESCRAYGLRLGLEEAGAFGDDGVSGFEAAANSKLAAALEAAGEGAFDILIVTSLDRLSRDIGQLDAVTQRLASQGVEVLPVRRGSSEILGQCQGGAKITERIFGEAALGGRPGQIARRLNSDRMFCNKLIRPHDPRAIRSRYEALGFTDVIVIIQAADKDGVVRTWRAPEVV